MIDELIESGQYRQALDMLEDMTNEEVRYKRLICLYGLQELRQAKQEGLEAMSKASHTYYDVVAIYVSILKDLQEYEEAIDILIKELSMPYIPYQYESTFNIAYDEILLEKQESNQGMFAKNKTFSDEDIENLLSRDDVNEDLLFMAIDQLQSMNIRRVVPYIRQFLQDNSKNAFAKSLLIELMIDQEIDEDMVVVKNDVSYDINPSYSPLVINEDITDHIIRYLSENIEDDNPSLYMMCEEFLHYYLYYIYPRYIDEQDYSAIAGAVHYYLATMQYIDIELEEIEIMYNCLHDRLLEIVEELKTIEI